MSDLKHRIFRFAERFVQIVEIVLALGLIMSVVGGMVFGAHHLWTIVEVGSGQSFQTFIDQSLLYIIGLEIAMMLIKHDPNIVLEILIFAIARKMIVGTSTGFDFFLGALAIFILYLVRHSDFGRLAWTWGKKSQQRHSSPEHEASSSHASHDETSDSASSGSL